MISRSHLELAILALGLLIAGGLLLVLGHGLAVWLERLAYGRRTHEARKALAEAIARGQADTRRYAKRQFTWFRHQMPGWSWVAPEEGRAATEAALAQSGRAGSS